MIGGAGVSTVTGVAADEQAASNNRIKTGIRKTPVLSKRLIPPLLSIFPQEQTSSSVSPFASKTIWGSTLGALTGAPLPYIAFSDKTSWVCSG
jgi:hypothetical protein